METIEVTRSGDTDQFSVVMTRGSDTIRCMAWSRWEICKIIVPTMRSIGPPFPRPRAWLKLSMRRLRSPDVSRPKRRKTTRFRMSVFAPNHAGRDMQLVRGSGNRCARHACHARSKPK